LPRPGSPTISTSWPSLARALPAAREQRELLLAADKRRQGARPTAPAAAAGANDTKELNPLSHASERPRAFVLGDEQPGRLPQHARGDEHHPRFGRSLHTRRDVRSFAEDFAGRLHYNRPGLKTDARHKLRRAAAGVASVEVGEPALDREGCAHCPLGVILLRLRVAKEGHQPVAELLQHVAAESGHRRRDRH
jgi:hypothetical protein